MTLLHCSFCGKSQKEVQRLFGSRDQNTYICDMCVDETQNVEVDRGKDAWKKARCRFCDRPGTEVNGSLVRSRHHPNVQICGDCVIGLRTDHFQRRNRYLTEDQLVKVLEHVRSGPAGLDVLDRVDLLQGDQLAKETLAWLQLVETRGELVVRTAEEFAEVEQPHPVMEKVLAAEVNILGGPSGAGKSLLARDWALHVAAGEPWRGHRISERRNVLWIASEGLHDFQERWTTQPLWEAARRGVYVLDQPVSLLARADVDWLFQAYRDVRPGLVVFDVIYGMGMADDQGTRDAFPVLNSMKRISAEWGAATLALGHPKHNSADRRLRGSSAWRQLAYCDWFMGDGLLTCEKSKVAQAEALAASYQLEYPTVRWLTTSETVASSAAQNRLILEAIERDPDGSDSKLGRGLAPTLGVSEGTARKKVAAVRRSLNDAG